jgi:hypothetical protein
MTKIYLFALLFFFQGFSAFAQLQRADDDYKASDGAFDKPNESRFTFHDKRNHIKVGLVSPIYGAVPVYYERELASWLSVEVGAGLSIRSIYHDVLTNLFKRNVWKDNKSLTEDIFVDYTHRRFKPGYHISFEPRILLDANGIDGWYMGFLTQFQRNNYEAQTFVNNNYTDNWISERVNFTNFALTWGNNKQKNNFVIDYGFGLGFSHRSNTRYLVSKVKSNSSGEIINYNKTSFYLLFFAKIGGRFGKTKVLKT